ncbi:MULTISPECIES: hypothetical protein [Haloferax]|uniref:Uncharacterized protein n=1 Tax=Haloferax massiliensis TaxID=1476858 RepID=A0A0D6JPE8_9EURY|nr:MULTISPECIES: hypothetical protein [Haloferax]MDS0241093.1 hypothetical protein [Haloferax sp. S2CR25]MDS0444214.1 hypothetical protein [Haloferax sp. S2CR25-2]CQR49478.1 hypothetical protein BN996_00939 [Haloferax massiliensis]
MRRTLLVAATVLVLLTAGVSAAFVTGVGPFSDDDAESDEPFPTKTTAPPDDDGGDSGGSDSSDSSDSGSSDSDSGGDAAESESVPPFGVVVDNIENCGQTCRDVTSTITNQQDADSSGVTVYSRIFVGNSTDPDDEVWRGSQAVGDLAAGESYTTTKRVKLSYSEAFAVRQADGWITVQTTIETDDRTLTYTEQRHVA